MDASPVPKKRARKDKATRRREILIAALDIVGQAGMSGLTTREIALRVEIAQPTVMLHFGSKDELLKEMISLAHQRLIEGLNAEHLDELEPVDAIGALVAFHFSFLQRMPALPKILFSEETRTRDVIVYSRLMEMVTDYTHRIAALVSAGQDVGLFSKDYAAEERARLIVALFQGIAFRSLIEKDRPISDDLAAIVRSQILQGLCASR
ncbi:MAG: TetR/AcrR family transcriptional regulator [Hyphomicrobiales bacterium]